MRRTTLGLLMALAGCTGRTIGSFSPAAHPDVGWTTAHFIGIVHAPTSVETADSLLTVETDDGARHRLVGVTPSTGDHLDGLTVEIQGTASPDGAIVRAAHFVVRSIGGRPVIDGHLEITPLGYAIRTPDSALVPLTRAPRDLTDLRGARLWVLLDERGLVRRFGPIEGR